VRDNGLPAQEWTHVADLDPRVADAALAALKDAGVAAYAVPHPGDAGPYLDVQLPNRPTDRLYVEAGARERAAAVLAALERNAAQDASDDAAHARSAADVDATFADIVARFELSTAVEEPLSADEDRTGDLIDPSEPFPSGGGRVIRGAVGWDDLLGDARTASGRTPAEPEDEEEEEGYVPPPPASIPRGTPLRRFAWAGVLGAPVVVALCVLFSYGLDGWTGLFVVAAFIGGLVTLVVTLEDRPLDDDGPDNGAVV
jgi:hypothetical protein